MAPTMAKQVTKAAAVTRLVEEVSNLKNQLAEMKNEITQCSSVISQQNRLLTYQSRCIQKILSTVTSTEVDFPLTSSTDHHELLNESGPEGLIFLDNDSQLDTGRQDHLSTPATSANQSAVSVAVTQESKSPVMPSPASGQSTPVQSGTNLPETRRLRPRRAAAASEEDKSNTKGKLTLLQLLPSLALSLQQILVILGYRHQLQHSPLSQLH
ncbi:uncharacterized protein LOC125224655 [Leguminivora glycinivorella]|uniref:uncharacterized protein LOC125224655 n=1 Tax=Leguminivora glycinivorella TaxID=1035111 RepID=UPI0020101064|nr:uncharacterized protein LOC125224655 [Leguminivora glycinivorella]